MHGPCRHSFQSHRKLGFVQHVIAAQQHDHRTRSLLAALAVFTHRHQRQGFDFLRRRDSQKCRHFFDGLLARRGHQFRLATRSDQLRHLRQFRSRLFHVGCVAALGAACDQVFAGLGRHHELMRLRAAHRPGVRLHHHELQPASIKNFAIALMVLLIRNIQPGGIQIERVRVLHDELPHSQQPRFRPRLIAEFRLYLIPDLRQLLIAAQLFTRDIGHHFFVCKAQAQVGALAVF